MTTADKSEASKTMRDPKASKEQKSEAAHEMSTGQKGKPKGK